MAVGTDVEEEEALFYAWEGRRQGGVLKIFLPLSLFLFLAVVVVRIVRG